MKTLGKILAGLALSLLAVAADAEYPNGLNGNSIAGYAGWHFTDAPGTYAELDAAWTVTSLQYDSTVAPKAHEHNYQWVGIRGANGPLVQAGTVSEFSNTSGTLFYLAFYECFGGVPNNLTTLPGMTVTAGDQVSVKIECTANCTSFAAGQAWHLTFQNLTQSTTATKDWTCVTDMSVAEPAVETGTTFPIANVGTAGFSNIHINNARPTMTNAKSMYFYATGGVNGTANLNPSDPNGTNDGFLVCWGGNGSGGSTGPYASCKYPVTPNNPGRGSFGGF